MLRATDSRFAEFSRILISQYDLGIPHKKIFMAYATLRYQQTIPICRLDKCPFLRHWVRIVAG
jgi:hypothetical protein